MRAVFGTRKLHMESRELTLASIRVAQSLLCARSYIDDGRILYDAGKE